MLSFILDGALLSLADSDGIGDENKTGLGEGDCSVNYRLENTFLGRKPDEGGSDGGGTGIIDYVNLRFIEDSRHSADDRYGGSIVNEAAKVQRPAIPIASTIVSYSA